MMRGWYITICTAVGTASILLALGVLLVPRDDGRDALAASEAVAAATQAARERAASGAGAGTQAAPAPKQKGTEGVPIPRGKPIGPAGSAPAGKARGGIPCGSTEQLTYHVHAYVRVIVKGRTRPVPLGIGIGGPRQITHTTSGDFVSGGSCYSYLHTHSSDGVIHIESPTKTAFTLAQLFAVWGQRLDRTHLGRLRGKVVASVGGKRFSGDPRRIVLSNHTQVQLSLGRPGVKQKLIEFPPGL